MKTRIPKKCKKMCPHNTNSLRMTSLRECENNLQPKGKQNYFFDVFELGYIVYIADIQEFCCFFSSSCNRE